MPASSPFSRHHGRRGRGEPAPHGVAGRPRLWSLERADRLAGARIQATRTGSGEKTSLAVGAGLARSSVFLVMEVVATVAASNVTGAVGRGRAPRGDGRAGILNAGGQEAEAGGDGGGGGEGGVRWRLKVGSGARVGISMEHWVARRGEHGAGTRRLWWTSSPKVDLGQGRGGRADGGEGMGLPEIAGVVHGARWWRRGCGVETDGGLG